MRFIPNRRWFQFRIQTLLAVMTIVALAGVVIQQRVREKLTQAEIAALRTKNSALEAKLQTAYDDLRSVVAAQIAEKLETRRNKFQLPHHERTIDESPQN
jgi:uncharacterized protein YpmS